VGAALEMAFAHALLTQQLPWLVVAQAIRWIPQGLLPLRAVEIQGRRPHREETSTVHKGATLACWPDMGRMNLGRRQSPSKAKLKQGRHRHWMIKPPGRKGVAEATPALAETVFCLRKSATMVLIRETNSKKQKIDSREARSPDLQ
jgi:hypothetical protein